MLIPMIGWRAMVEIEAAPLEGEPWTLAFDGIGTIRFETWRVGFGRLSAPVWGSSRAALEASGGTWQARVAGLLSRRIVATDTVGALAARFTPKLLSRGGNVEVGAWTYTLGATGRRYVLREREAELVTVCPSASSRRPLTVTLADPRAIDPLLVLFAAFVAHRLAAKEEAARSTPSWRNSSDTMPGTSGWV
jgi:hypothetical protein